MELFQIRSERMQTESQIRFITASNQYQIRGMRMRKQQQKKPVAETTLIPPKKR
jgi:hypothetical protein